MIFVKNQTEFDFNNLYDPVFYLNYEIFLHFSKIAESKCFLYEVEYNNQAETNLELYENGQILIGNILETLRKSGSVTCTNLIIEDIPDFEQSFYMACSYPSCMKIKRKWLCSECNGTLCCNNDSIIYCSCGNSLITNVKFRCSIPYIKIFYR